MLSPYHLNNITIVRDINKYSKEFGVYIPILHEVMYGLYANTTTLYFSVPVVLMSTEI